MRIIFLAAILAVMGPLASADTMADARAAYLRTDFDGVIRLLARPASGAEWLLAGKAWFMKAEFKRASEAFERAVAAEPNSAEANLWLGRAFGRRAETSSMLTAPGYASKARKCFERAVELDGRNRDALNDLFEYYLQAPGFLGGGEDKARALIDKIAVLDPAERYFAEARLAETHKEWHTVEAKLRRAVEAAPRQVGRAIDLAKFLAQRGRFQESEETFRTAEKIDPKSPRVLFERAAAYVESKRNYSEAAKLLERYLASQLSPEDPPRVEAERLLKVAREAASRAPRGASE